MFKQTSTSSYQNNWEKKSFPDFTRAQLCTAPTVSEEDLKLEYRQEAHHSPPSEREQLQLKGKLED